MHVVWSEIVLRSALQTLYVANNSNGYWFYPIAAQGYSGQLTLGGGCSQRGPHLTPPGVINLTMQ